MCETKTADFTRLLALKFISLLLKQQTAINPLNYAIISLAMKNKKPLLKKLIYDVIFMISTGAILVALNHFGLLEKYVRFAFIPLLITYYIRRFVESRAKRKYA